MDFSIKVRFLSSDQIAQSALEILRKYQFESTLPIPIEHIIDNVLCINIIPFPNLFADFEINAFVSSDLKKIYVDEYLYTNLDRQYRFTLAHEFGHIALHEYVYADINIKSLVSRLASFFPMSSAETGHFQGESSSPLGASFLSADPLRGTTPSPSNSPAVARPHRSFQNQVICETHH